MLYQNKPIKYPKGFTLLEIMIAVSLFTVVMLVSTTMFIRSIDSQARSINSRNLQEALNYALALMSSEAVGATQNPTTCSLDCTGIIYETQFFCSYSSNTKMIYKNAGGLCVIYELENDANGISRLKMTRNGVFAYITPPSIRVTSMVFNTNNTADATYPIGEVTMSLTAQTLTGQNYPETLNLQTSVATTP